MMVDKNNISYSVCIWGLEIDLTVVNRVFITKMNNRKYPEICYKRVVVVWAQVISETDNKLILEVRTLYDYYYWTTHNRRYNDTQAIVCSLHNLYQAMLRTADYWHVRDIGVVSDRNCRLSGEPSTNWQYMTYKLYKLTTSHLSLLSLSSCRPPRATFMQKQQFCHFIIVIYMK